MLILLSTIAREAETGKTMFERVVSTIGNYLFAGLFANIRDTLKFAPGHPGEKLAAPVNRLSRRIRGRQQ
tara:strand:- start:258 stop:467 length:210 start_codon:yes stop_codon:yes gene_type:complete